MYMQQTRNKAHLERNIKVFALLRGPAANSSTPKAIMCHTTQPPHPSTPKSLSSASYCSQNQPLYQCQEHLTVVRTSLRISVKSRMKLEVGWAVH